MNHSIRRKTRHLLHFLLTWVVICTQITLPLGALLAAVQPTPPMAQAVAQQAGLGEWLASAAGKATAWAQPLWGQPKTAAAQTVPVLESFTSTTADGTYTNGDAIAICGNYDIDVVIGSTLNVTLDTGGTLALKNTGVSIGGTLSVDSTYATGTGANSYVHAMALQADGKAIIGGQFTTYNGTSRNRITRINTDGSLDSSFTGGGLNNYTEKIAIQADGKAIIVGHFTTVNDTGRNYMARLNTDGSLDTGFTPTLNNVPYALAIQPDGKILISGSFSTVNGTGRTRLARLNSDGTLDTSFNPGSGLNHYAEEILVQSDGKVVIGGHFSTVNGTGRTYIARLNSDGSLDTGFNPSLNDVVTAAALQSDGKIVISGYFSTVNGTGRTRLARLNSDGTLDTSFDPGTGLNIYSEAIIVQTDGPVMIGGHFTDINGMARNRLARLNANGSVDTTFVPGAGANNVIYAMALQSDGLVVIGGAFTDFNGTARNYVTRVTGSANTSATPAKQVCGTYRVAPGHTSSDLTVSTIVSASVTSTSGGVSNATTIPSGQNLGDNKNLVIQSSAPGGIGANLRLWLKADGGVTQSGGVSQWDNLATGGQSFTQATSGDQPLYVSNGMNFNPVLNFPGSQAINCIACNIIPNGTDPISLIYVADYNTASGQKTIMEFDTTDEGGDWPALEINGQKNGIDADGTNYQDSGYHPNNVPLNQPSLLTTYWSNSNPGTVNNWIDGGSKHVNSQATGAMSVRASIKLGAGSIDGNGQPWNGNIAEAILYNSNVSDANLQRIHSYLALKYGISLDQATALDYLDSDGTVIWNGTTNATYKRNIAGIGRDVATALNQKQSKSVNSGFQPAIGLGAIAATNAANANSFSADKSFMIWGSNNLSATFGTSYTPTSFTPAAGYFRMNRVWKVQETGTITNVVVQAANAEHLLVSSDPTFATGVTEVDMSSGSATVDFSNGQYFTFGRELTAPGGVVSGLGVWLRADYGTSSTTDGDLLADWADFSSGGNDVTQPTAGNQPKFKEVNLNFNPALEFDGSNDVLYKSDGTTIIPNQTDPVSMLTVSTQRAGSGWWQTLLSFSGAAHYPALHWFDGRQALYIDGVQDFRHSTVIPYNTPTMFASRANNATPRDLRMANNGLSNQDTSTVGGGAFPAAGGSKLFSVGSQVATGGETLNGFLNEAIVYNRFLNDGEVNRIHSYFAIKYGMMFDSGATDYVATDGTTVIWNATANSGYKNNIAGIGRDDAEGLNQKQSQSINSGFQPIIGLDTIATTNAANSGSFSANKNYLIWGDNDGSTQFATAISGSAGVAVNNRMTRVWKVQNTGNVGQVKFAAPSWLSLGNTVYLVVSNDTTFDNTDTFLPLTALTVNTATYLATDVTLTNGQYFSLATFTPAPGGVNTSLGWWFQGNVGVQSSGGSVYQWNDSSTSMLNVSQATGANQPTVVKYQNFNPIVTFDGANDYLRNSAGYWKSSTSNQQFNTFIVATNQNTGGINALFREDTSAGSQMFLAPYGGNVYNGFSNGYTSSSNQIGSTGVSYLWSGRFNNSSTPKLNSISQNGKELSSSTSTTAFNGSNAALEIGANSGGWWYNGDIAEEVMYATDLNATQRQQVLSYLALKWGLTLDQSTATNYLDSTGATIWNAASAGSYNKNIAGIGFDLSSGLNQKQARSSNTSNSGNLVAMSIGAFANTNLQNSGAFAADRSFVIWSDNGDSTTVATLVPGISNPQLARMERSWQVQETGTVGTVRLRITQSAFDGPAPTLIRSTDTTFDSTDSFVTMTDDGGGNYQAQIDFANGDYFTFAHDPIKELFGKTGNSTAIPAGGSGTITTTWQITYNNVTGRLLPNVVLTDTWSAGQTLVPASVQTPGGDWTWSLVNGTTLKFSNPLVVPNGQGIGKSLTIPMPAGVNLSGGGDGYNPAIVLNTGRAYGMNHHTNPANVWCFDPITAGFCTGYPKNSGVYAGYMPFALAIQDRVYFNADATHGDTSGGIYCLDTTTDTFGGCGSNANAKGLGLVYVNTKLYYLKVSANGGGIGCVDPNNNLADCAGYTTLPIGITPGVSWSGGGDMIAVGSKIYVSDSNNKLNCYDAATATYCAGWSATPKTLTAGRFNIFPRLSSLGVITGICLAGNSTDATCYTLDGSSSTTAATAAVHRLAPQYTALADTYLGTRVFFATFNTATGLVCWDWALNSGNGGACTGAYFNANGETTTSSNSSYGVATDGSNLFSYGDLAVLQSWNPATGQSPSVNSVATINVNMDSYYSCVASSPVDLAWHRAQVYDTNLDPGTDFEYLNVTVIDSDTGVVLFGPVNAVGTTGVFDISTIPNTYRLLRLVVSGKAANNNAAWADGIGPKAALTYISNTAPQFCYQTRLTFDCNSTPNLSISNQVQSALTIGTVSAPALDVCNTVNLMIAKSGPVTATQGTNFNYNLVVTNTGTAATSGVITVTDILTAGLSFVSGSGFTCAASGQTVTCTSSAAIAVSSTATINLTVNPTTMGVKSNSASVIGGGDNSVASSNTVNTTVVGTPDLIVTIGQPAPAFVAGVASNVPMTVTNNGTGATTGPITATMTLPANTSAPASFNSGPWSCTAAGQSVTCVQPGPINAGASSTIQLLVTASPATVGTQPGPFTGGVTTPGDSNPGNNPSAPMTPSTPVSATPTPNLLISKSGPANGTQGVNFSYTLVVTNTGTAATSGVITVTDILTGGLSFVSGSGFTCAASGQTVTCTSSAAIAISGTATITLTVNPMTTGVKSNSASVIGGGDSSAASSNTVNTTVVGTPDLTVTIGQPAPAFVVGAPSNVPMTVTNSGTGPTTGPITATMTLPTNTSAPASFNSGPWSCTTAGQTVTCVQPGPINAGASSTVQLPVTASPATVGTQPGPFTGGVTTPGDSNPGNNPSAPMTPTNPVAPAPTGVISLPTLKLVLGGAYDVSSGLMRDELRSKNLLPTSSPYAGAPGVTTGSVFSVTGNNAIVDWVLVEARNAVTPTTISASQAAFVQRDGDVVALDGVSALTITVNSGNYYVAVKHRNHLGAMTRTPIALSMSTPAIDFTAGAGYGTNGQAVVGSVYALWMGNTSGDNRVIGAGPSNDRNTTLSEVLSAPGNSNHNANYIVNGYSNGDVNLDGRVIAAGPGNDINYVLYNIFVHPGNGSAAANFVVQGQVP